jgi:hypothetical protein
MDGDKCEFQKNSGFTTFDDTKDFNVQSVFFVLNLIPTHKVQIQSAELKIRATFDMSNTTRIDITPSVELNR